MRRMMIAAAVVAVILASVLLAQTFTPGILYQNPQGTAVVSIGTGQSVDGHPLAMFLAQTKGKATGVISDQFGARVIVDNAPGASGVEVQCRQNGVLKWCPVAGGVVMQPPLD